MNDLTARSMLGGNWRALNAALMQASELDCKKLLLFERAGKRRLAVLLRIHARYNVLRAKRERAALLRRAV